MPYSLENNVSRKQATHEAHRALLDKVLKSEGLISNKCSEGNLLLLNGSKGVLNVIIVKMRWLRGTTRSDLTRVRGWIMGCRSNNLLITGYPIKVTSVK